MINLSQRMSDFASKISGTTQVDNMTNPKSAAYKLKASIRTPAQQKANETFSTLPKQQVLGVPGVSRNSQLPAKYQ